MQSLIIFKSLNKFCPFKFHIQGMSQKRNLSIKIMIMWMNLFQVVYFLSRKENQNFIDFKAIVTEENDHIGIV